MKFLATVITGLELLAITAQVWCFLFLCKSAVTWGPCLHIRNFAALTARPLPLSECLHFFIYVARRREGEKGRVKVWEEIEGGHLERQQNDTAGRVLLELRSILHLAFQG